MPTTLTEEKKKAAPIAAVEETASELSTSEKSLAIVKRHMVIAGGAALVPFPVWDIAGITAVQFKMLKDMGEVYGQTFKESAVKNTLAALIGSIGLPTAALSILGSVVKFVPIAGTWAGALTMPVLATGCTYAVGKVFIQHFEAGGTFLNLDPEKTKAYFKQQFEEGKLAATPQSK